MNFGCSENFSILTLYLLEFLRAGFHFSWPWGLLIHQDWYTFFFCPHTCHFFPELIVFSVPSPALWKFNWHIKIAYVYDLVWYFDTYIHCEVIKFKLINMFITYRLTILFVVRKFRISSLSKFQVYNALLLTVVPMLYSRFPEVTHPNELWTLTTLIPCPHPPCSPWQPPLYPLLLCLLRRHIGAKSCRTFLCLAHFH